jgi:hypothetical protein
MIYPEKLKNESDATYRLFKHYLDLGNSRNIEKLAYETKKSDSDIKHFQRIYNWDSRVVEFEKLNPSPKIMKKLDSKIHSKSTNPNNLKILQDIQKQLFEIMDYVNQNLKPENVFKEEDDEETKLNKTLKIFKLIETYIRITEKIEKNLECHFNLEINDYIRNLEKLEKMKENILK